MKLTLVPQLTRKSSHPLTPVRMTQSASVKNCRLIGTTDIRVPEPARRRLLVRALELTLLLSVICLVATGPASAAPYVYVVSVDQQFGVVDLATGHFSPIGSGTPDGLADLVWWKDGTLLTLVVTGPNIGSLAKLDPTTGEETLIGPTGLGLNIFSLGKARGNLYATDFGNNLYSVDPMTGAATLIGATGMPPDPTIPFTFNTDGSFNFCDQGFYNIDGQLYATFDSLALDPSQTPPTINHVFVAPAIYRIDPSTGITTLVAQTSERLAALVQADGKIYAFQGVPDAFNLTFGFPVLHNQLVAVDLRSGTTTAITDVDHSISLIIGAAPVRGGAALQ